MTFQDDYADMVFYENKLSIQDLLKVAKDLQTLKKELNETATPSSLNEKIFYNLYDLGSNLIRYGIYNEGLKCFEDALVILNNDASTFTVESLRRNNGSRRFINMLPIEYYSIMQTLTAFYTKTSQHEKNYHLGEHRLIQNNSLLQTHLLSIIERELIKEKCRKFRKKESFKNLIGISREWLAVLEQIQLITKSEQPVLITGPSGVGKELVANAIHLERGKGNFVPVNCAYITDELVVSELYGHEKGSFTGAVDKRIGYCEEAVNGTLFLDEIAETSLKFQGTLLRFLQEREFTRLGSNKKINFQGRIIAATNKNIWELIDKGSFREDLYWRLEVHKIEIPSLSERLNDLDELIPYILKEVSPNKKISIEAIDVIGRMYEGRKYKQFFQNKIQRETDDKKERENMAAFWNVDFDPIRQNNVRELKNSIMEWTTVLVDDNITAKDFSRQPKDIMISTEIFEIPSYTAHQEYQEKHIETLKALDLVDQNQSSVAALFRLTPPAIQQRIVKAKQKETS